MHHKEAQEIFLSYAIERLIDSKRLSNRRPRYLKSLEQFLKLFARGRESHPITAFSVDAIESWLAQRNDKPTTRQGNIGRLSSLFSFAYRRRWIPENPCDRIEKVTIEPPAPRILSPDDCERLMRWAQFHRPDSIGYFAKTLFAGIRPEETEKLEQANIDEGRARITIDASVSKVRSRRIIELQPAAVEWIREARRLGCLAPFSRSTRQRIIWDAKAQLNFKAWPQDILRHSFASYAMATHRNAGLVADWLGNSPSILLRHYRELVSAENALAFWSIRP